MNLTEEDFARIIKSRKMIKTEGYYQLKVTNVTEYEGKKNQTHIANLKAMTRYNYERMHELLAEGEMEKACNQQVSMSLFQNNYIPSKGEYVKVYFEWIEVELKDEDGHVILKDNGQPKTEKRMYPTSMVEIKTTEATTVGRMMDNSEEEEEEEEVVTTKKKVALK